MTDRDTLISAWLTYKKNWWAFEALDDQVRDRPDEAWGTILALIAAAEPEMLRDIGAGPLEDFVGAHGDAYIDQIEHEASLNPKFQEALQQVWLKPDENGVVERLAKLGCDVITVDGGQNV